jgi:hypothetical protein
MTAIPVNNQNIEYVAKCLDVEVDAIEVKLQKSKHEYRKNKDKEWILDFFNADEAWYEKTKKTIQEKAKNLSENLSHKEKTKALYGWIADDTKISGSLSIPLEEDVEYSKADCIKMVFHGQIDLYLKIVNWD